VALKKETRLQYQKFLTERGQMSGMTNPTNTSRAQQLKQKISVQLGTGTTAAGSKTRTLSPKPYGWRTNHGWLLEQVKQMNDCEAALDSKTSKTQKDGMESTAMLSTTQSQQFSPACTAQSEMQRPGSAPTLHRNSSAPTLQRSRSFRQQNSINRLFPHTKTKEGLFHREEVLRSAPMHAVIKKLGLVANADSTPKCRDAMVKAWGVFSEKNLTPSELSKTIHSSMHIKLTPVELGCLCRYLDQGGTGHIDIGDFLHAFYLWGRMHTKSTQDKHHAFQIKLTTMHKREEARILRTFAHKRSVCTDASFDNKDLAAGQRKVGANLGKATRFSTINTLDRLSDREKFMDANQFKHQLWMQFNVRLKPQEFAAMWHHFDREGTGQINSALFVRAARSWQRLDTSEVRVQERMAAVLYKDHQRAEMQATKARFGTFPDDPVVYPEDPEVRHMVETANRAVPARSNSMHSVASRGSIIATMPEFGVGAFAAQQQARRQSSSTMASTSANQDEAQMSWTM
jgi:hypothetical protein